MFVHNKMCDALVLYMHLNNIESRRGAGGKAEGDGGFDKFVENPNIFTNVNLFLMKTN